MGGNADKTSALTPKEKVLLFESLYYLHVSELKEIALFMNLPLRGMKGEIVDRIKHAISHSKVEHLKLYPKSSVAEKGQNYPLSPHAKILFGVYKNDSKTRAFMKTLVGEYFHFTAFGQDWLREKWKTGNPPTYLEFAIYWDNEYSQRKVKKVAPKREWAYLNFIQYFLKKNPRAPKNEITQAWNNIRMQKLKVVKELLKKAEFI